VPNCLYSTKKPLVSQTVSTAYKILNNWIAIIEKFQIKWALGLKDRLHLVLAFIVVENMRPCKIICILSCFLGAECLEATG
jgi:hypothetical protein